MLVCPWPRWRDTLHTAAQATIIAALPGAMALCSCVIGTESASLPLGSDVRAPGDLRFFGGGASYGGDIIQLVRCRALEL